MSDDLTLEISHARHILRLAAQSGYRTHEACLALEDLRALSRRDRSLHFEVQRWSFHLDSLRSL